MPMEYATLGKAPIAGDNPTGGDCRYEPEFERLQAEIDKLSSPTASGKVDWAVVVKNATDILEKQSKDLTVASYLAVGLLHTQKINGLDQGIQVICDLVESHWDKLFPSKKRMRGRQGAFAWWLEKSEEVLQQMKIDPIPAEQIERVNANLKSLDEQLVDKMPDPPLLRPVLRQIENLPVQQAAEPEAPEAEPERAQKQPKAEAAPASKSAETAQPAPAPAPTSIGSDQDARKSIDAALQQLRKISLYLLQQDLKNPMAYRYRRLASWAKLESIPLNTDGATQIQSPPPQMVSALEDFRDEGNWPALILNAEQKISQFIFWFDLGRLVAEGLKNLGPEYKKALAVVCQETASLVQRFPGLENLAFADGTAFADPETRKWLQSISIGQGDGGEGGTSGGSTADAQYNAIVQEAMAMARKKRVVDAVALLQRQMEQAVANGQRMRWRLAIAQVLLVAKKSQLALPHVDQILTDIDTHHLETWDPVLAVEGLTMAWKGYSAQAIDAHKLRALEILGRIAKINPSQALNLQK